MSKTVVIPAGGMGMGACGPGYGGYGGFCGIPPIVPESSR